mgnify:CR=1 FL=1|jgi:hypothetical protein|tara:strand:- start:937 stop:1167 length:231 start_codon:yes stop_codon:yes gene_type:complete
MKSPVPRGKDGTALGVGDIVDVCWQDGHADRATILSLEEVLDKSEIRIFDSVVLWSTGEKGLASTAIMKMVSKAER